MASLLSAGLLGVVLACQSEPDAPTPDAVNLASSNGLSTLPVGGSL